MQVSTPSGVNMRDQASVSGNVVAIEPQGALLTVIGPQQNGWLHVQDANNRSGWVYSASVSDAGGAPAAASVPQQGAAQQASAAPSILAGSPQAASSGLVGLAVVSGAVLAAKWLL